MPHDFAASFLDTEGRAQAVPATWETLAFIVGLHTVGRGWVYLGREPLGPCVSGAPESEVNIEPGPGLGDNRIR